MPVVLLIHCDGTNGSTAFADASPYAHGMTVLGPTISTTSPKFGTGSGDFNSAGARIALGSPVSDFNLGAGQFTVEAWAYFLSAPTGVQAVVAQFGGSSNLGWFFGLNAGTLAFFYSTTGTDNPSVAGSYAPTTNTWYHLAADRDASNVLRVYANGAVVASATVSATIFPSTQSCLVGNDGNFNRNFPGRLDEIRITKGLARYAGAFTPPTAPFADTSAIATQALAEHWLTTNPQAQITQVVAEHWASVASGNLQAVVTQVLLEHWTSVAVVVPAAGGPMVTMIH